MVQQDGNTQFLMILIGLIASQFLEYAIQIFLFRRLA